MPPARRDIDGLDLWKVERRNSAQPNLHFAFTSEAFGHKNLKSEGHLLDTASLETPAPASTRHAMPRPQVKSSSMSVLHTDAAPSFPPAYPDVHSCSCLRKPGVKGWDSLMHQKMLAKRLFTVLVDRDECIVGCGFHRLHVLLLQQYPPSNTSSAVCTDAKPPMIL